MAIDCTCDRIDKINIFAEFRVRFVNLMIIYGNYMQINVTHTNLSHDWSMRESRPTNSPAAVAAMTTTHKTTDYAIVCGKERKKEMEKISCVWLTFSDEMRLRNRSRHILHDFHFGWMKKLNSTGNAYCVWVFVCVRCVVVRSSGRMAHICYNSIASHICGQITQPTNDATTLYRIDGHSRRNKNACIRLIIFIYYWPLSL